MILIVPFVSMLCKTDKAGTNNYQDALDNMCWDCYSGFFYFICHVQEVCPIDCLNWNIYHALEHISE